jgi:hypothetical protein
MIKSWNHENVEISQRDGTWATQLQNEEVLTEAFKKCRNVYLVFSVNKSMAFQGYVRFERFSSSSSVPRHFSFDTLNLLLLCTVAESVKGSNGVATRLCARTIVGQRSSLAMFSSLLYSVDDNSGNSFQQSWTPQECVQ